MPVRLSSEASPENEARIEIIPLIDIMFFLLASFMLVSLGMITARSVRVNLPTATHAGQESTKTMLCLSVDSAGTVFFDKSPVGTNELATRLSSRLALQPELRVFISGDRNARHGDIVRVLDAVRGAGVQNVAFEIRSGPDEGGLK